MIILYSNFSPIGNDKTRKTILIIISDVRQKRAPTVRSSTLSLDLFLIILNILFIRNNVVVVFVYSLALCSVVEMLGQSDSLPFVLIAMSLFRYHLLSQNLDALIFIKFLEQ